MGRAPCCAKVGLHKGPWTAKEDALLTNYIRSHGEGNWRTLPAKAGLLRCGKSCRLRWVNYLRPDVKRGNIAPEEEDLIIRLHALLGNRWSLIAGRLPGRTDNEIKNFWNTHLSKKLKSLGADTRQGISEAAPRRSRANSHKRSRNKNHSHHNHKDKRESKINEIRDGGEATRNKIYCPKPTRLAPIITKPKVMEGSSNSMDETENTTSEQDKGNNNIQNSDGGTLKDMDGTNNVEDFEFPSRDDLLFESLFQEYSQLLNSEGDELQLQTSFAESLPA